MTRSALSQAIQHAANAAFFIVAICFFAYLFHYYWTSADGPTLLAFTLVPITFVVYVLDALRKGAFYPALGPIAELLIALVYIAISLTVSIYMHVEFEEIGTVRAGSWDPLDIYLGGAMFLLVMEFARRNHSVLFGLNIILILYAVYGFVVPGMFYHPGLSWTRIITSMSLEDTTGVFSNLPQLALTLIGSFVLVLSVLRAFGCVDSILNAASRIAVYSPRALPQAAVVGSFGIAAVSGSGAANAVTTGSATIPAMINAGLDREDAAAIESASSLGGQLMPPIMGISAFLMANFLDVSYFDVVARGYAPALIYFIAVALGVYLLSARIKTWSIVDLAVPITWVDKANIGAFLCVVIGLILLMAVAHQPPMFAALYIFLLIGSLLLLRLIVATVRTDARALFSEVKRALTTFIDNFTTMTAELTLLLATLSILTSALVNTGVPTKVGFILVDAASINLAAMVIVAFLFGALLGAGLPPAPTYILTALVIAPHMIKAGVEAWPVHFFAFFLAVWGELTPPTSVVAAVTSRIANGTFLGTLWRALMLCSSLFVLMAAMFLRPELVLKPGLDQLWAMGLVLMSTIGITFALQARFTMQPASDLGLRMALMVVALIALAHPDPTIATLACGPIALFVVFWVFRVRPTLLAATPS